MNRLTLYLCNRAYSFDPANSLRVPGKFSSVYKGKCEEDGKAVLIKKLNSQQPDAAEIASFRAEGEIPVVHPNLCNAIGYVAHSGSHYVLREFIEGSDLKEEAKKGPMDEARCIPYFLQVLDALSALHTTGILHCDLRPANIIIEEHSQTALLTDLGLARPKNANTGRLPFAMIYSPPEQLLGRLSLINERSDLYALGVTLYEMLSGKSPYHHDNPQFLINLQLTQALRADPKIRKPVFEVIERSTRKFSFPKPPRFYSREDLDKLMAAAQSERYATAREMKEDLLAAIS